MLSTLVRHGSHLALLASLVFANVPAQPPIMDEWEKFPVLDQARDGITTAVIGTKLYAFGGSSNITHNGNTGVKTSAVLNTESKSWSSLPALSAGRCCAAAPVYKDEIFVMGGMQGEDVFGEVEVYNVTANYWHHTLPLPTSRCCMAAVTFNGEFWVMGGGDNRGFALDVIEVYSPKTKKWRTAAIKLSEPRTFFGAAVWKDSIIVVGGQVSYEAKTVVQKFYPGDLDKGWVDLSPPEGGHRAFGYSTIENYLFIIGGLGKDSGLEPSAKVEVYDMKTDTWFPMAALPSARDCPSGAVIGNKLLAIGGFGPTDKKGKVLNEVLAANVALPEKPEDKKEKDGKKGAKKGDTKEEAEVSSGESSHHAMWLLFLMILGFGGYAGGGAYLNHRDGASGVEMLPHYDFWMELPALCMDGVVFLAASAVAQVNQVKDKVGPEKYERLPEDADPW